MLSFWFCGNAYTQLYIRESRVVIAGHRTREQPTHATSHRCFYSAKFSVSSDISMYAMYCAAVVYDSIDARDYDVGLQHICKDTYITRHVMEGFTMIPKNACRYRVTLNPCLDLILDVCS